MAPEPSLEEPGLQSLELAKGADHSRSTAAANDALLARLTEPAVERSAVRHAVADSLEPESGKIRQVSGSFMQTPINALKSGFKSGAEKVSSAFTPSPVNKIQDPTSLSTKSSLSPRLYVAMARFAEQSGRVDEAEQRYRQALQMAPEDLEVLTNYARMKERQGRADEAIGLYKRAAKAHPDNAPLHNDWGLCLARRHELREAVVILERATQLDPKRVLYRNNIATVLVEMGKIQDAFHQMSAVHPKAVAYYNVGYLVQKKGQPEAAASLFAQALKTDPSLDQARFWLAKLTGQPPAVESAPGSAAPRLEDPSVQSPDLQPTHRQAFAPTRREPTIYAPSHEKPRPLPSPRIAETQAATPIVHGPGVRQLPPVIDNQRRPMVPNVGGSTIIRQSFENLQAPAEEEPESTAAELPGLPPAPEEIVPAPAPEQQSPLSEAEPEVLPPAPLPPESTKQATPLP